ncbi:MAG: alpha/beta hydrolase [Alphaproteobacteria bacterium]|nr:alpha/beta hydrolase [Alphaproteobacteria bacterium]MBT4082187.1 alpha/beta hydrolase [Alphaproteobacteria bacterium]MBT4545022.1 alpha/beta hydrolase [Alphaproteobacteria bacterium]MBT7745805.1 alpha/beta hydrolase [Alphaproteobacteria bacterium]
MASFRYNESDVNYDVTGHGPDVLFMHGLTADRRQASAALDALEGYRLISVDMPGHGDSELSASRPLSEQVGFEVYTDIAAALLDHLGIEKVIAGGISMGSGIALALALMRPDLVQAMFLVRPAWLDQPGRPHLGVIEDIGNWIAQSGPDVAREKLRSHPVYMSAEIDNPSCASSLVGAMERPQAEAAAMVLPTLVADRPVSRLGVLQTIAVPALVVGNNADPLHPAMIAREICGALANATYFHAPPKYLEPEAHKSAVTQNIKQFLEVHRLSADASVHS